MHVQNSSPPTVSVIIPCYNCAAYLEATVHSVLSQTYPHWECVLVDDGSTDATAEVILALCLRSDRIRSLSQTNGGRAAACNHGFKVISDAAQYLFYLDSDDILQPDALGELVGYLEEHLTVGLVACRFDEIDETGRFVRHVSRGRWVPGRVMPRRIPDNEYETPFVAFYCARGQGPFALFRRSVFIRTKGYEESIRGHEDTDIFCQMALEAPVHFIPNRLYQKRTHRTQITAQCTRIQDAYRVFRAKWDAFEGRTPREQQVLAAARNYYAHWHKPCREMKVALGALRNWGRQPNWPAFRWAGQMFASSLRGFCRLPSTSPTCAPKL